MIDLAFYNAGDQNTEGPRKLLVLVRRMIRRVLRPIFFRQVEIYQHLIARLDRLDNLEALRPVVDRHEHSVFALHVETDNLKAKHTEMSKKQEELSEQVQTALAFGWDYVALVRRLATLEDQVAALTGTSSAASDESEPHSSILFPGLEKVVRKSGTATEAEVRSKVS